ncbi:MAG: hypothetical protein D8H95_11965 [Lachnospiraceae bacterium]|nr:MAG: hypothetical protein D8H95_11965 [Lachnospiraceae bacterium]
MLRYVPEAVRVPCYQFFNDLKKEECNRRTCQNTNALKLSSFQYIDGLYNTKRPHGSLGLMSPNEKERDYYSSK